MANYTSACLANRKSLCKATQWHGVTSSVVDIVYGEGTHKKNTNKHQNRTNRIKKDGFGKPYQIRRAKVHFVWNTSRWENKATFFKFKKLKVVVWIKVVCCNKASRIGNVAAWKVSTPLRLTSRPRPSQQVVDGSNRVHRNRVVRKQKTWQTEFSIHMWKVNNECIDIEETEWKSKPHAVQLRKKGGRAKESKKQR